MDKLIIVLVSVVLSLVAVLGLSAIRQESASSDKLSGVSVLSNANVADINGVKLWAFKPSLRSGTTSVINFKGPNATTTMMGGSGCSFALASTSAKTARISKASTPNASTTLLVQSAIGAGAQGTVIATTTPDTFIIKPNQYINVDLQGGAGVDSPVGSCSFLLMQA